MIRLVLSLLFFAVLSTGAGVLMSGKDQLIDWRITGGLFALALVGELVRFRVKRGGLKLGRKNSQRESSGI